MTTIDHQGRVAVVTAAAGAGIGGSTVRRLHADGATVVASDIHGGRLERLADELGIETAELDVADGAALAAHLHDVEQQHGRVDVLVNCAGANVVAPTWEVDDADWDRVMAVNLGAPFRASRAVLPGMLERGSGCILNIASIAAWNPAPAEVAYSTTKAGLIAFTRALANEVASSGVRVNAVAPGFVQNPFLEKLYGAERMQALQDSAPLGRGVLPEEVAGAISWLVSDEAAYVTGETLTIAGGQAFRG